jgi:addiction module HigA family antidote
MRMHNPPHPGQVLKTLCLEPLKVSITEAARALGMSRKTLSAILNGRAGISPEMAVRLSIAFGTSAESWLNHRRSMTSGMPNSAARSFESESLRPSCCHNPHFGGATVVTADSSDFEVLRSKLRISVLPAR